MVQAVYIQGIGWKAERRAYFLHWNCNPQSHRLYPLGLHSPEFRNLPLLDWKKDWEMKHCRNYVTGVFYEGTESPTDSIHHSLLKAYDRNNSRVLNLTQVSVAKLQGGKKRKIKDEKSPISNRMENNNPTYRIIQK